MSSRIGLLAAFMVAGVGACGHGQPYRTSGPESAGGVQLAVTGERCSVSADPENPSAGATRLNVATDLQVANQSDNPVLLARDHFKLSAQRGSETVTTKPLEAGLITILPGETTFLTLSFEERGDLDCRHELSLDPADAIQVGGAAVRFRPIRFTPR